MILNKIKINDTDTITPGVVYDISKATGQSYDTLSDALSGNNVPLEIREGGMSVRFVHTGDNKYVQYRLMSDEWSTTESDWRRYNEVYSEVCGNDLEFSDEKGNNIVIFSDGNIKTKNFDSKDVTDKLATIENGAQLNAVNSDECVNDLEFSDNNNSVAVFYDGNIKTKNFDSSKVIKDKNNEALSDFDITDKNDNTILSVDGGYPVTKNFNGKRIKEEISKIPSIESTIKDLYEEEVVNIADYNNNLMNVYDAITPTENKHYTILIPEGTYDVSSWFSQSQIENSNETHWSGLILKDYTKLLGVGCADKVILQWMNPDTATHWGYISTLNTHIWNELENLTIKANNIRYAVHDDPHAGFFRHIRVKNCYFIVSGKTSRVWGCGTEGGYDAVFENCKFIMEDWPNYHFYSQDNYIEPIVVHDYTSNTVADNYVTFKNCRFVNPYTDLKFYFHDSWEKITYNSNYEQYDADKTDYAVDDCVNMPNDTDYSYKCLYANTQLSPYKIGRPCINIGFGAGDATRPLYVTVEGCKLNTYIMTNPSLSRITGFGDIMGSEPTFRSESNENKNIVFDII